MTVGLAAPLAYASAFPGLSPSGFIFHMTRCGSTLAARMLGAASGVTVAVEPELLNQALAMSLGTGPLAHALPGNEPARARLLRSLLGTMARGPLDGAADTEGEQARRFFVKFTGWNVLGLDRVRACFPGVPWVFVVRTPLPVLVAQLAEPTAGLKWGLRRLRAEREREGLPVRSEAEMASSPDPDFAAAVLRGYLEAGLDNLRAARAQEPHGGGGRIVDYGDLKEQFRGDTARFLGLRLEPAELEKMTNASRFDAKRKGQSFSSDAKRKAAGVTAEIERASEDAMLGALYAALCKERGHCVV